MSLSLHRSSLVAAVAAACVVSLLPTAAHSGVGAALDFDGVDDFVRVADPVDVRGPLTIEAWVNVRTATNGGRIVSNAGFGGYQVDIFDDGIQTRLRYGTSNGLRLAASFDAFVGTWTHVAITWAGDVEGTLVAYINGTVAATGASTVPIGNPEPSLWIGTLNQFSSYFDGLLDDIRIWSAELDEQTIETWMGRTLDATHPDFVSLEAAWSFDEGTGQVAASLVGSPARDGQLGDTDMQDVSDPTWVDPGVVPSRAVSMGQVKGRYLPPTP